MANLSLGVDVGGTFTDFVLLDADKRTISIGKRLTTPRDPSEAIIAGARELLDREGIGIDQLSHLVHGTTLVANTIIERRGAPTGVIASEGFRDTLEIGRELRYDLYDLFIERPEPLVPRKHRLEVPERVDVDGKVVTPLDVDAVEVAARALADAGVEAIAVAFLHSYRNPAHERAARERLAEKLPDLDVSISSDVSPEIREYDRTSTTVANAYVRPLMRRYLDNLERELRSLGLTGPLYIMLSSGGLSSVKLARDYPIRLIESGPAAGAIAASFYGKLMGQPDLISFDMGGTTAKICLINGGQPAYAHEVEAARVRRFQKGSGLLVKVPVIEMVEIGAGGGSIAHRDKMGLLKVGPHSASAEPGPVCYGRGGIEPTVTDADLVLGYLDPGYFLGGQMRLDREAAERQIYDRIGKPLGLEMLRAAVGIHDVVNDNMATATRIHIAERGRDPRAFDLIAFGGAGPVHAYRIAKLLKLRRVVFPLGAGTTSALGFLVAPLAVELVRSYVSRLDHLDWGHLANLYEEMESQARQQLAEAGVPVEAITLRRSAEMRYVGQGYEIPVAVPAGKLDADRLDELKESFYGTYQRLFNRSLTDVPIEALTWRLAASGPAPQVDLRFTKSEGQYPGGRKGSRSVYFPETSGYVDCPVYDRYSLAVGQRFDGPAIVEERESTVVIGPGALVRIDEYLNLIADVANERRTEDG